MYIPGLHLLHNSVAEPLSLQYHEVIAKVVSLHPLPVIHKQPRRFVGGIIGVKLILVKTRFSAPVADQHRKLYCQQQEKRGRHRYPFFSCKAILRVATV